MDTSVAGRSAYHTPLPTSSSSSSSVTRHDDDTTHTAPGGRHYIDGADYNEHSSIRYENEAHFYANSNEKLEPPATKQFLNVVGLASSAASRGNTSRTQEDSEALAQIKRQLEEA